MNIQEKELKLEKLKQILYDYEAQSTSAGDDTRFLLDKKEEKILKEIRERILEMELRILELKKGGKETDADKKQDASNTVYFDAIDDELRAREKELINKLLDYKKNYTFVNKMLLILFDPDLDPTFPGTKTLREKYQKAKTLLEKAQNTVDTFITNYSVDKKHVPKSGININHLEWDVDKCHKQYKELHMLITKSGGFSTINDHKKKFDRIISNVKKLITKELEKVKGEVLQIFS